ncbi:MAG: DUF2974 domain-containing protein [Atopobiaceae bacterium]|nr:DUF2974 domain-containing protein [Atopobiaceae bacterium]
MPEAYKNIIDYVWEHGDTFDARPLCRVDSLVLSQLSYFRLPSDATPAWGWSGLPVHELWRSDWLDEMTGRMYDPHGARKLASALAASPRFRDVLICGYADQLDRLTQMQFSAMSFVISPEQTYVAFRGTDNTIVGWKENLNMAFQVQVPSQISALHYLERTVSRVPGRLWCGGHSKGGNMAIYAGMTCAPEIRSRLECCFSHDGPGFTSETLAELEGAADHVKVDKTVPQSSIFGMLFDGGGQDVQVVHSVSSGFAQHDPLSWEVEGCDFVIEERLGRTASYVDSSLNAWIERASPAERQHFVEAVFAIMAASEKQYTHDIRTDWRTTVPVMARAALDLDPETRDLFVREIIDLVRQLAPGGE